MLHLVDKLFVHSALLLKLHVSLILFMLKYSQVLVKTVTQGFVYKDTLS